MMEKGDIYGTPEQKKRAGRDLAIVSQFKEMREKYPLVKNQRIFVEISTRYQLTPSAIRIICKNHGVC